MNHRLGSLLGRWHQWRRGYSHERGYSRPLGFNTPVSDDELECMLMASIEDEVSLMPRELQLAVQHVARAECLGVEVFHNPHLPISKDAQASLVERAMDELERRLERMGVL